MSTEQLAQLATVGNIAMELWRAQETVTNAKHAYHLSIQAYEAEFGRLERGLRKYDPEHEAAREYTAPKYQALQKAKRRAYQVRNRLHGACAKMARISAQRQQGATA